MDLAALDRSATAGHSALHRAAPVTKLVAFACALAAVIVSENLLVVGSVAACLVGLLLACRLPVRPMLALAAYPGLFALLFAFAWATGPLGVALVVAKAVTAALAAVVLAFTTPYPQVFAPLQRVLPRVLGDALLMTYRSLFLLLETFTHTLTAARLRAGLVGMSPVRSAVAATRSLGGVLLYSVDLSQRTYDVMRLRGYDGRLVVSVAPSASRAADAALVAGGLGLAGVALAYRAAGPALAPWAWMPLAGGVLVLIGGLTCNLLPSRKAGS